MKRKTFLIQILVLLFTFQNIWSVAEAACLHEMLNIPNSMLSSPIALDEKSDSPSQALYSLENYKEIYDYCQKVCFNEKCSHFSNTIVIQIEPPDDWYTLNYQETFPWEILGSQLIKVFGHLIWCLKTQTLLNSSMIIK